MVAIHFPRPLRTVGGVVGGATAALSIGLLLVLPVLASVDPDATSLELPAPSSFRWWVLAVGLAAQGVVLAWAGQAPKATLIASAALAFAVSWSMPGSAYELSNVAVLVAVFYAVVAVPRLDLRVPLSAAGLMVFAGGAVNNIGAHSLPPAQAVMTGTLQSLGVIGMPFVIGLFVRTRREVRDARRDEHKARKGEREAQIQAAVAQERAAMARELHDIAAHHLSGIALMAAVVDRQIDSAPEQAHISVRQVRAQSTKVLDDMRRLVGLLRDDTNDERSVESFATISELVDRARVHGTVELNILTAADRALGSGIGPLAQLAAYRTIQEALTNAATHSPGALRTVVVDDRNFEHAVITITNPAPDMPGLRSPSGGFGLIGMQERADLLGAALSHGPTDSGGWQVRISIPRETSVRPPLVSSGDADSAS